MLAHELSAMSRVSVIRPQSVSLGIPIRILFLCLILSSTYDKSGVTVEMGGRDISISAYKMLFGVLVILYVASFIRRLPRSRVVVDRRIYGILLAFVVVQTAASLLGSFVTSGSFSPSSEIYYFIQRFSFLFIPLFAMRFDLSPKTVLKWFVAGILVHELFIALQFLSPNTYVSFVESVSVPIRPDNTFEWDGQSWAFIGIQRTANYGTFVAALGFLMFAFSPTPIFLKLLTRAIGLLSMAIATVSPSRSVLIMVVVALLVLLKRKKVLSRLSFYVIASALGILVSAMFMSGYLRIQNIASINAFVDPEREGSNMGKLLVTQYALELFAESPIVGWGQQRFSDISASLGNDLFATSYTHSYWLSTLLSSGTLGVLAYLAAFVGMAGTLWRRREKDYAVVCSMFLGLGVYNIIYDAGGLDVFACFNGIAAYYALRASDPGIMNTSEARVQRSRALVVDLRYA